MSSGTAMFFFLIILTLWFFSKIWPPKHKNKCLPRPPGPRGLPIIGHFHMLGNLPHRSLHKLAQKYGPIMQLRLGFVPTVVVSSPEAAELFLKEHDISFASRPTILVSEFTPYGSKGLVFSKSGSYWRNIRKLCTVHLLSISKMESFVDLRKEEMLDFIRSLKCAADGGEVVNISHQIGCVIENITCGMIFGSGYKQHFNFKACVEEALMLVGAFNIAEYIPFLKFLDLQGLNRGLQNFGQAMSNIQDKIIEDHQKDATTDQEGRRMDFIDILLSLIKSNNTGEVNFDTTNVKAIAFDMLAGSLESTAKTIEWALAELLRYPRVMKLVQDELATVVGLDRMVEESDLKKLGYLDMVIKETMRLHPVGAFLVPRESLEDTSVGGYFIAKKSRIIVNAWAIGRDPDAWPDKTEEFYPERFMSTNVDVRGHDMQLIPFGAGRRKCPAIELALRTVHFVLAQLVHCFDFKLPDGMSPKDIDVNEKFGLAMSRANPLHVIPIYHLNINNI